MPHTRAWQWIQGQFFDPQHHVIIGHARCHLGQRDVAADHQFRHLSTTHRRRRAVVYHRASTKDGEVIADAFDLMQFMTDEQHRGAIRSQPSQGGQQLINFLRRQYGRWLIEDQGARAGCLASRQQGFDDFNPLLLSDPQILNTGIGVDAPMQQLGNRADALPPRWTINPADAVSGTQDACIDHRRRRHQGEMLMDHTHAQGGSLAWRSHCPFMRADGDGSRIGPFQAEQDPHQG